MAHAFAIEPSGYTPFASEEEEISKCREWGLLSDKATKTKAFTYKRAGHSWGCRVVGYADAITAVIAFDDNGQLHCIHPSYLKEMQAASFGNRAAADTEADTPVSVAEPAVASQAAAPAPAEPKKEPAAKQGKKQKLQLPEDKVRMTATVQQFTKVMNHFTEEEDEVVVYENVAILEPAIEVGVAWSSHSATLKKLALEVGDKLTFDAKIAAKKLLKHPVPYKINNPSKIVKQPEE